MLFYCTRLESENKKTLERDEKQAKKMENEKKKISTGKYDSSDDLVAKMMALPPRSPWQCCRFRGRGDQRAPVKIRARLAARPTRAFVCVLATTRGTKIAKNPRN